MNLSIFTLHLALIRDITMNNKTASIGFIILSLSIASCNSTKRSCSSLDVQNLVIQNINSEVEGMFVKRPLLNPRIILNNIKIALNDIVLESDNTHQLTCSATVTVQIPSNVYSRLSQPQILTTFKNFGHMGDARLSDSGITSSINYQVKSTEDTQKIVVATEQEPAIAKALWISAMLGVWE